MRELFEIRSELNGLDNKMLMDEPTFRRLLLELLLHVAVGQDLSVAASGGNSDWAYENDTVTTVPKMILDAKKGDEVMVRISNWDDQELRVVYVGTDGPVSTDQGIPIQPGEEKILQIKAPLWAVSPYVGDLIDIFTSSKNLVIPVSEDNGVTWLRAEIAEGQYDTGQAYALAVAAALNAMGGGSTYTCSYNPTTRELTYTSDGAGGTGTFLIWYRTAPGNDVSNWAEAGFKKDNYPNIRRPGPLSYNSEVPLGDNPIRIRIGKAIPFKKRDRDFF